MKKIIITLLVSLIIIGCNETSTENNNLENLENTSWVLQSFEVKGEILIPPSTQKYEITFLDKNKIEGRNDCNEILGTYKIEKNNIKFIHLGTSYANCGSKSMYKTFYSGLWSSKTYLIKENKLTINFDENSKLLFIKNNF